MTHNQTPDEMLDVYLDALAHDPQAQPPPGMDPEIAAFAQMLAVDRPQVPASDWQAVLDHVTTANNGQIDNTKWKDTKKEWEQDMTTLNYPRERQPGWLTLVAALMVLSLFGGLTLFMAGQANGPHQSASGPFAFFQEEATPTFTPTPVPVMTVTPMPPTVAPPPAGAGGGGGMPGPSGGGLTLNDIFTEIPPQPIVPNESYTVTLDSTTPFTTFDYVADGDVFLLSVVETNGVPASFRMSVMSAPSEGLFGGGGGGGGGGPLRGPRPLLLNDGDQLQVAITTLGTENLANGVTYTIRFIDVDPTPITPGEPITTEITEDQPFAVYTFPAAAGEYYTIRASGEDGFDTMLDLSSQGGFLFSQDSDGGPGLDPEIYRLPNESVATGYLLVVPEYEGETGTVTVSLRAEPVPDITQSPIFVRITPGLGSQLVRVTGEPGTTGTVSVGSRSGDAALMVSVSDGETVLARTSGENISELRRDFVFPETGEAFVSVGMMGGNAAISEVVEIALAE